MLQLPVELRRLCLEALQNSVKPLTDESGYCPPEDERGPKYSDALKAVRLVNQELGTLATELLFRTVVLDHNDESAGKFDHILRSERNALVRHIVINTDDDPEYVGGGQEEAEIQESFADAIKVLHEFTQLEEVEMKFSQECAREEEDVWSKEVAETVAFRHEILEYLFGALSKAEKVSTLTIKNLQDYHDPEIFEHADFVAVRERLTKLHLQIATEYDDAAPEHTVSREALHSGFGESLPNFWLKPTNNQLTHLTLYGAESYWGVWPFVDFRTIPPFPHLKYLSVGNFTIAHEWQIDWIVAHGATLETLLLDDSMIFTVLKFDAPEAQANFPDAQPRNLGSPDNGYMRYFFHVDLRWHTVLDRFRAELPLLKRFGFGHGVNWDHGRAFEERDALAAQILPGRYAMYDCGIGPSQFVVMGATYNEAGHSFFMGGEDQFVKAPECEEEDRKALEALMEGVRSRGE